MHRMTGGWRISVAAALVTVALAAPARAQGQGSPAGQYPSLRISGFGDVNFEATTESESGEAFSLGQLALHMISELSPRVTFFGEVSFSPRADAGTGSPAATGFNVEVERMILRWDQSDRLKLSVGRYHTPINYWNTAYHHGQWLQTTITRPEMIRFGSRLLPVHFVGGLVEGAVPAAGWNLNYKAGVGNGRASVISRAGDAGDSNDDMAFLANVFVKPDQIYGLEFGGSAYLDDVTLGPSTPSVNEQIVSGYVVWHKETPEIIAEFAGVRHDDPLRASPTWATAYYVQVAYRLPSADAPWKPYLRFEHIDVDDGDRVLAAVEDLDLVTLGMRFDMSDFAALKGEYRSWERGGGPSREHGLFLQVSFTF